MSAQVIEALMFGAMGCLFIFAVWLSGEIESRHHRRRRERTLRKHLPDQEDHHG